MNPDEDISDERAIDGFYFARKAVSSHWTIQDLSSVIDEVLGANLEGLTGDRPLLVVCVQLFLLPRLILTLS
jgi:hypothetical protein